MNARESPPAVATALGAVIPPLAASIAAVGFSLAAFTLEASTAASVIGMAVFATFLAGGLWLSVVDAREHRIPDTVLLPLTLAVVGALAVAAIGVGEPRRILEGTIGAAAMLGVFFVLGLAGGIGFGDVKLAGLIGFYLAWHSPTAAIAGTVLAYVFAAPHAIVAIVRHRRTGERPRIAFGPYMLAAAAAVLLFAGA